MLTAAGITAARAADDRRLWIAMACCMALFVAYMAAFMTLATWYGAALRVVATGYLGPVVPELLWGLAACPAAILMPGGLLIHARRDRLHPDPRLTCPACAASIGNTAWVIATRRCGRCDKPILAEPEEIPPMPHPDGRDDRLIAIDDFNAAASEHDRRFVLVVGGLAAGLLGGAGIKLSVGPVLGDFVAGHLGPTARDVLLMLALVALVGGFVGGLCLVERGAGRDPRLVCPWCGKALVNLRHLAVATRNCGHCGRQALTKRPSDFA